VPRLTVTVPEDVETVVIKDEPFIKSTVAIVEDTQVTVYIPVLRGTVDKYSTPADAAVRVLALIVDIDGSGNIVVAILEP